MPRQLGANVASCMRCHSDPNLAPDNLTAEYGDKAGFGEKVGDIRAIISLNYPLDEAFSESYRQWLFLSLIAFIVLAIFYAVVTYFLYRMHRQHLVITRQTQTDSLTGLLNRRQMNKNIDDIIKNEQPISLIMMDIDHFKIINDTFGHTVGDDVLVQLAQMLLQLPKPINSYRFGGEEFLLLLPKTDAQQAAQIAETLRQQVSEAVFLSINTTLTISLGVATNTASDTSQTLLKRADNMLYLAKQKGRNRTETDQDSPDS
jgi:two-component system cell cycle response regulator